MTWIDNTSLAAGIAISETVTPPTADTESNGGSIQALPNFMHSLFVLGVSPEIVQAWLKQADFTNDISLADSFKEFQGVFSIK